MTKSDYFLARRQILGQIAFWTPEGKVVYRKELDREFSRLFPKAIDYILDQADVASYKRRCVQFIMGEVERRGLLLHEPLPLPPKRRRRSRKHAFVNIYLVDKACYSPAEGGCWCDYGCVVESIKVGRKRLPQVLRRYQEWVAEENADRNSNISSVASDGRYEVEVSDFPGSNWPDPWPTYC